MSFSIACLASYVPDHAVPNAHFASMTGKPEEWFEERTGMRSRRRADPAQTAADLAIRAVLGLGQRWTEPIENVDVIIGASYTQWDNVGTIAHRVQRAIGATRAKAFTISSACCSFLNGIEVALALLETGRARSVLLVASEHNSAFANDADEQSGHLWGDGAAAALITTNQCRGLSLQILDIETRGLGHVGKGPDGVYLAPKQEGLVMPFGRDVFAFACREMESIARVLLVRNNLTPGDLRLLVPHQANRRIIDKVSTSLGMGPERVASTVEDLGNTGCASIPITLEAHRNELEAGDLVLLSAFGGGYSSAAALLRVRSSTEPPRVKVREAAV